MSDRLKNGREFVGYEYKEIAVDSNRVSFLIDAYANFGWQIDKDTVHEKKTLQLKRNRRMINKTELTRLQRNFESCMDEIDKLEKAKTATATIYALIFGIAGTAFMAGSVFAVTAETPRILLCVLLAIPGFAGWIVPYFLYQRIVTRRTERLTPLIEEKYEEIYEICEKGSRLLYEQGNWQYQQL